jgi:integrase
MAIHKLSAARIAKLTKNGMYGDGGNLWLSVTNNGAGKSWVFRWTEPGTRKDRNLGLGPLHTVDLDRARELAKANRLLLQEGKDPKAYRDERRLDAAIALGRAKTVGQVADEYWDAKIARKSLAYRRSTHIILRDFVHAPIGAMPIQKVDRSVVLEMTGLQEAWTTKHVTANAAHRHLRRIFDLAIAKGYYRGENPASWDHLKHTLPARGDVWRVEHYASLPFGDVGRFMERLRAHRFSLQDAGERGGKVSAERRHKGQGVSRRVLRFLEDGRSRSVNEIRDGARITNWHSEYRILSKLVKRGIVERVNYGLYRLSAAKSVDEYLTGHQVYWSESLGPEYRPTIGLLLEFIILTAVRGGEVLLAQWKEIDIPHRLWHVPPEHRKTGPRTREVRSIPISKPMLAVLEEMQSRRKDQSDDALIFPAARGGHFHIPNVSRYMREAIAWETPAQPHGFRSTLRDWCRANMIPDEYWQIQTDHAIGDRTSQSYGHDPLIEQRRDMMEKWGEFCSRPAPEPQTGEVIVNLAERRR